MVWTAYKNKLDTEMLKILHKKHSMKHAIYCYEIRRASEAANKHYARMPRTNRKKAYEQNEMLTKFMLDNTTVIVHSFSSNGVSGKVVEVVTQKTEENKYLTAFTIDSKR